MYMPVNNVVDTNSLLWFGFHQFLGAVPAQKNIPMLCRQVCATGSCRQSCVDPRWQNTVHQWWSFTGKMCFCLPWSFSLTTQGSAFCSELTGAYKKASSVDG